MLMQKMANNRAVNLQKPIVTGIMKCCGITKWKKVMSAQFGKVGIDVGKRI
jgi:hypothetical protein